MSSTFDWYLISQGLGMQWDAGTILLGYAIPVFFAIIIIACILTADSR